MWGYLQEFWDAITGVVVEAGNYTAAWFQSLGNAVAGAIGGAFDWFFHYIYDTFIFARWLLSGFSQLFSFFTAPLSYIYQFVKPFWLNAIKPPPAIDSALTQYATSTMAVLNTIPYFDTLTLILGIGVLLAGAVGLITLFLKIY